MSNLMKNPLFRIIRGVFIVAFLTFVWLIIFSAIDTSGSEINYEPFQGASIVFAILSYVIIYIYNLHLTIGLFKNNFWSFRNKLFITVNKMIKTRI